jgi:hypothetical protein
MSPMSTDFTAAISRWAPAASGAERGMFSLASFEKGAGWEEQYGRPQRRLEPVVPWVV